MEVFFGTRALNDRNGVLRELDFGGTRPFGMRMIMLSQLGAIETPAIPLVGGQRIA